MTTWAGEVWTGEVVGGGDPFARWSDDFASGATMTGRGWSIEDTAPSCSPSDTLTNGEADLTVAAGSAGGSFWFDANDGALWHKEIAGPCDFRARVRVEDGAGGSTPPTTQFRIAGIAIHDPNRAALNYVHVGLGSNNSGALQEEWKTTDDSDSAYAYTPATLTGGELLYDLRIVRRATDDQVIDLYVRAGVAEALESDVDWTRLMTVDRTDDTIPDRVANNGSTAVALPLTLRWGFMLYANDATHDIRMFVLACRFSTTTE